MKGMFFIVFLSVSITLFSQKDSLKKWHFGIELQNTNVFFNYTRPFLKFKYSNETSLSFFTQRTKSSGAFLIGSLGFGMFSYRVSAPDLELSNMKYGFSYYNKDNFGEEVKAFNTVTLNYYFSRLNISTFSPVSKNFFIGPGFTFTYYRFYNSSGIKHYEPILYLKSNYFWYRRYVYDEEQLAFRIAVNTLYKINKRNSVYVGLGTSIIGFDGYGPVIYHIPRFRGGEFPHNDDAGCVIDPFYNSLIHVDVGYRWIF